jgi:hypothetical protein
MTQKDTAWYVANAKKNYQAKLAAGKKVSVIGQTGVNFGTPACLAN